RLPPVALVCGPPAVVPDEQRRPGARQEPAVGRVDHGHRTLAAPLVLEGVGDGNGDDPGERGPVPRLDRLERHLVRRNVQPVAQDERAVRGAPPVERFEARESIASPRTDWWTATLRYSCPSALDESQAQSGLFASTW